MQTLHGVGLNIFGMGVILTGNSGVGKSELGLELISRGHKLVTDDSINLQLNHHHQLYINNPSQQFIMYIREIGFIDVARIYGEKYTISSCPLSLIINLTNEIKSNIDPLERSIMQIHILGVPVPQINLSRVSRRSLASLVEVIIRQHQLLIKGIDSHEDFISQHNTLVRGGNICNLS